MDIDLKACASGNREAWEQFVQQTAGLILAAIRRTAGSQLEDPSTPDIEDFVQAVYLKLLRNDCRVLLNYDPKRAALSTWISLIARSVTIDTLRRKTLATTPLQDFDHPENTAHEAEIEPGSLDQVAPMHLLTQRQELVLRLLFEDKRSVPEVAQILDVGEQTIRSTKHKALERLRGHFKGSQPEGETTE